jgi:hypothetical protein
MRGMRGRYTRRRFARDTAATFSAFFLYRGGEDMREEGSRFPSVKVGDIQIPRIIIGINSLLGWSHTSGGRDRWIRKFYTPERIADVFARCIELGVTAVFGPVYDRLIEAIDITERKTGVRLTYISTTFGDPKTTSEQVKRLRDVGAPICLVHGGWTDQWEVKDGRLIGFERILEEIRKAGMIPGAACHRAERLRMLDEGDYDCELFAIPVNKTGFCMYPSRDAVVEAVNRCRKPVIAIKPLSGGRFDENGIEEWLRWTFNVQGVIAAAVGFMSAEEAEEDIGIGRKIWSSPEG